MASLGELTAGIAHEIQNPLNFVNNFSEVNKEMLEEATEEIDKGNLEEVKVLLGDIKENEEKINHHGKRADAIVKGMLQHSRKSEGKKEPTDINALCDEYLRLSYHGLSKINIVPQDIGRVLLNLFNNAFYAVSRPSNSLKREQYKPLVSVRTRTINPLHGPAANIEIIVSDNGNGIPRNIVDKIFQPFFTTKPTGQGTGLGLSLAYDIIKAHGGEIKVETKEDKGSKFILLLPIS
jgi:two-component system NtrC family sensor kinase